MLAQRFGGRWVFGIGVVMTAVLTLLTPLAANLNVWVLVAVRAMEGFFEVRESGELQYGFLTVLSPHNANTAWGWGLGLAWEEGGLGGEITCRPCSV